MSEFNLHRATVPLQLERRETKQLMRESSPYKERKSVAGALDFIIIPMVFGIFS